MAAFDLGGRLSFSGQKKDSAGTNMVTISEKPFEHALAVIVEATVIRA